GHLWAAGSVVFAVYLDTRNNYGVRVAAMGMRFRIQCSGGCAYFCYGSVREWHNLLHAGTGRCYTQNGGSTSIHCYRGGTRIWYSGDCNWLSSCAVPGILAARSEYLAAGCARGFSTERD